MQRPKNKIARSDACPSVSIIIPVYNAIQYVNEAIDSVLNQIFTDYEIIVVNDGSPETEELEQRLDRYRGLIRYLKQENRGPGGARNKGLTAARGNLVAFLDADDYWQPDFLTEQVSYIQSSPAVDLVYADALLIGGSSLAGKTFMQTTPSEGEVTLESLLDERCTVVLSGVVARRQRILDVGLFDESFRFAEDYDLWLRLAKHGGRLCYQRKVLLCRRIHEESLCEKNVTVLFENALRVLEKVGRADDLSDDEQAALIEHEYRLVAYLRLERGKDSLLRGEFAAAANLIRGANRFYRSWKLRAVLLGLRLSPYLVQRLYSSRGSAILKSRAVSEPVVVRSYE